MKNFERRSGSSPRVSLSFSAKPKSLLKLLAEKNKSLPTSLRQSELKNIVEAQILDDKAPEIQKTNEILSVCGVVNEAPNESNSKSTFRFKVHKVSDIANHTPQTVKSRFNVTKVKQETQQDQELSVLTIEENPSPSNDVTKSITDQSDDSSSQPRDNESAIIKIDDDFPSQIRPVRC